nr:hypothetical protein [uncultured Desulfovibrio sp.]
MLHARQPAQFERGDAVLAATESHEISFWRLMLAQKINTLSDVVAQVETGQ